ncbi:MAG: hypothetical protein Q9168_002287 [Polycauliona sp. 1 TL-2023]
MGHFPPYGEAWVDEKMDEFLNHFRQKRSTFFSSPSESWVILGIVIDENGVTNDGMDPTSGVIFNRLVRACTSKDDPAYPFPYFDQEQYRYHIQDSELSPVFPGKGSVFVDTSDGKVSVYVEDSRVAGG